MEGQMEEWKDRWKDRIYFMGPFCLLTGGTKIVNDNHDQVLKHESILFCDDVNELCND